MNRTLQITLSILLLTTIIAGQTSFMQLTPGKSSRTDASRLLGQPVTTISETLLEYRPKSSGQKVYVQYRPGADVIDRVEVFFEPPMPRAGLASMLGLPERHDATKYDKYGSMEEYFGGDRMIVLIHETSEAASPVIRVGYFSRELFALALQKDPGQPRKAERPSQTLPPATTAKRSVPKTFKDIDLIVPKGDKSETKSVRLLFDGQYIVIDADKGEKIYKEFAYPSVVSGEYSYSSSPRWKTAIGAAVLIGVFALPLFFMKSKKHWLTIKTADDFAILRLDKDNYKLVLATFETSVGKKVETVADTK